MPGVPVPIVKQRVREDLQLPGYRQNLRADPAAFGATVGEGASKSAQVMVGIWSQEQEKADAAVMLGAYAEGQRAVLQRQKDLAAYEGLDAIQMSEAKAKDLDKDLETISAKLGNQRQRNQFAKMRQQFQLGFEGQVNSRVIQATDEQFDTNFKASVAVATEAGDLPTLRMAADTYAKHRGLQKDGDAHRTLMLATVAPAHENALAALATSNDFAGMRSYLAANGSEMTPHMRQKAETDIKAAEVRSGGLELAGRGAALATSTDGWYLDLAKAGAHVLQKHDVADTMSALKKSGGTSTGRVYTDEMRAEAMKHLEERAKDVTAARRSHDDPFVDQLKQVIDRGGAITRQEPNYLAMSPEGQQAIDAYVVADRRKDTDQQNIIDLIALSTLRSRTPNEIQETHVDTDPDLKGLSRKGKAQAKELVGLAKRKGVDMGAFVDSGVVRASSGGPLKPKDEKALRDALGQQYQIWKAQKENLDLEPNAKQAKEMHDEAFLTMKRETMSSRALGAASALAGALEFLPGTKGAAEALKEKAEAAKKEIPAWKSRQAPPVVAKSQADITAAPRPTRKDPKTGEVRYWDGKDWTPSTIGGRAIDLTRPIIRNPDGSISTERTITVESAGKHFLIPTIVGGKQLSNDDAIAAWRSGKNAEVGVFNTAQEAEVYAVKRSQEIGRLRVEK